MAMLCVSPSHATSQFNASHMARSGTIVLSSTIIGSVSLAISLPFTFTVTAAADALIAPNARAAEAIMPIINFFMEFLLMMIFLFFGLRLLRQSYCFYNLIFERLILIIRFGVRNFVNDVQAVRDFAERGILTVKMRRVLVHNEEL
jgi:hypothetical protein